MRKHLLDHLSKGELFRLLPDVIIGAEGEDDDNSGNEGGANDGDKAGNDSDDDAEGDDEGDEGDDKDPKNAGLRSALAKERRNAREAQRELKKLQKAESDRELANKSDIEKAQAKEQAATDKVTKLAAGLLRDRVDAAIAKAATSSKFIDTDDAIAGVDRSALTFSQDEDDPTDITIDTKTVERAVKALAAKKPHFIASGTDDGEATGGKFGGSNNGKKGNDEQGLLDKYPALR